jgi:hypothetical protein
MGRLLAARKLVIANKVNRQLCQRAKSYRYDVL